jgi:hypothetical protein
VIGLASGRRAFASTGHGCELSPAFEVQNTRFPQCFDVPGVLSWLLFIDEATSAMLHSPQWTPGRSTETR